MRCFYCEGGAAFSTKRVSESGDWLLNELTFEVSQGLMFFDFKTKQTGTVASTVAQFIHTPSQITIEFHSCCDQPLEKRVQMVTRGAEPKTIKDIQAWANVVKQAVEKCEGLRETRGAQLDNKTLKRLGVTQESFLARVAAEVALFLINGAIPTKAQVGTSLNISQKQLESSYKRKGFKSWEEFIDWNQSTLNVPKQPGSPLSQIKSFLGGV